MLPVFCVGVKVLMAAACPVRLVVLKKEPGIELYTIGGRINLTYSMLRP